MSKNRQPRMMHGQPSKGDLLKVTALQAEQKRILKLFERHNRAVRFLNRNK